MSSRPMDFTGPTKAYYKHLVKLRDHLADHESNQHRFDQVLSMNKALEMFEYFRGEDGKWANRQVWGAGPDTETPNQKWAELWAYIAANSRGWYC